MSVDFAMLFAHLQAFYSNMLNENTIWTLTEWNVRFKWPNCRLILRLLHVLSIIEIQNIGREKNSFAITITTMQSRLNRFIYVTLQYKCIRFFRSFLESYTQTLTKKKKSKKNKKIVQTRISKRWIHIKDTKHRWMVLFLSASSSQHSFFSSFINTHIHAHISVVQRTRQMMDSPYTSHRYTQI